MRKHLGTLLLFALASFYFLTTDIILSEETMALLGKEKVVSVYSAAMLLLGIGFALFAFFHKRTKTKASRKLMLSMIFSLSAFSLLGFVTTESQSVFISFFIIHMLTTGVIGGAVHYYSAMSLSDRIYSGRVIGLAIGLEALMQVLLLMLLPSSLHRSLVLIGVLVIVSYMVLFKTPIAVDPQKCNSRQGMNPPSKSYLYSLIAIVAVISLMGGFNDGIATSIHSQQRVNLYTYPRLLYLAGIVAAGYIADMHARRYLPVVMLSVMMCSSVGILFLHNPITYFINICIFFLFAGFAIMYFTVTFFDIAPAVNDPMLWAGMGRIIRFAFIAIGAISSNHIFSALPFDIIIGFYILMSVVLLVLFYISGTLASRKQNTIVSGRTKNEMMNRSKSFVLTKREEEILSYIIDNARTREIAESLFISERTVKFHVTNILSKTGAKNRLELLVILSKNGE